MYGHCCPIHVVNEVGSTSSHPTTFEPPSQHKPINTSKYTKSTSAISPTTEPTPSESKTTDGQSDSVWHPTTEQVKLLAICNDHALYYNDLPSCSNGHLYCPHCNRTANQSDPPAESKICNECDKRYCHLCSGFGGMKPFDDHQKFMCIPCWYLKTPEQKDDHDVEGYIKKTKCPSPDGCGSPLFQCSSGGYYCTDCEPAIGCIGCGHKFCASCQDHVTLKEMHDYDWQDLLNGYKQEYQCQICICLAEYTKALATTTETITTTTTATITSATATTKM